MALSTTDLGTGGSGMAKTIAPGNHTLKINSIVLEDFTFIEGAKHIILNVETEPLEGFEGFMVDKDDASKGHYAGQIGRIKASQYAFADGETKSGIKIQRDRAVLIFLQNLCKALGVTDWFTSQDGKHDTIEDFVKAFNESKVYENIYLDFCVAGKEYVGKTGYTNYDMYLPKADRGTYVYTEAEGDKLMQYNEALHLKKAEVKEVNKFGDDDDNLSIPSKTSSDFSLD
jgi:hypothetical protein